MLKSPAPASAAAAGLPLKLKFRSVPMSPQSFEQPDEREQAADGNRRDPEPAGHHVHVAAEDRVGGRCLGLGHFTGRTRPAEWKAPGHRSLTKERDDHEQHDDPAADEECGHYPGWSGGRRGWLRLLVVAPKVAVQFAG